MNVVSTEQAVKAIVESEGLTRLDIGFSNYQHGKVSATVWYPVPDVRPANIHGCSTGEGDTFDEAIDAAMTVMAKQLARCAAYVPAMVEAA